MQHPKLAGQTFGSYSGYMGVASAFRALGFEEVGRASETQLIMRMNIKHDKDANQIEVHTGTYH